MNKRIITHLSFSMDSSQPLNQTPLLEGNGEAINSKSLADQTLLEQSTRVNGGDDSSSNSNGSAKAKPTFWQRILDLFTVLLHIEENNFRKFLTPVPQMFFKDLRNPKEAEPHFLILPTWSEELALSKNLYVVPFLQSLILKKSLIPQQGKVIRRNKVDTWHQGNEVGNWLCNKYHWGLNLKQENLVCLDLDLKDPNHPLVQYCFNEIPTFITTSPRGFHFLFRNPNPELALPSGNQVLTCGISAEVKIDRITFVGEGYELCVTELNLEVYRSIFTQFSSDDFDTIPEIPGVLRPLKRSPKLTRKIFTPLLHPENLFTLVEGERNESLFRWASLLRREEISEETIKEVLVFLNNYATTEKLPLRELESILQSVMEHDPIDERSGVRKGARAFTEVELIKHIRRKWETLYIYIPASDEWRKWNTVYWEELTEISLKKELLDTIELIDPASSALKVVNEVLNTLAIHLNKQFPDSKNEGLINFRNGIFDVQTRKLFPHEKEYYFTYVLDCDYDYNAKLSSKVKELLCMFVDNNAPNLNILRAAIRRAINPCMKFQTGLWIYGPPGTGKSTLISWLHSFLGDLCIEFSCSRQNLFDRARMRNANVIVISEGQGINPEANRLLKTLTGRDLVSYDVKYKQVKDSFRFRGILFVTSNVDLGSASVHLNDLALFDRMLEIEFPLVPQYPSPTILDDLKAETPALINWALSCSAPSLLLQLRVGMYNLRGVEKDCMINFLGDCVVEDPQGFAGSAILLKQLDEYAAMENEKKIQGYDRKAAISNMQTALNKFYGVRTTTTRKTVGGRKVRGIKGIRLLQKGEEPQLVLQPGSRDLYLNLLSADPFINHEHISYDKLNISALHLGTTKSESLESAEKECNDSEEQKGQLITKEDAFRENLSIVETFLKDVKEDVETVELLGHSASNNDNEHHENGETNFREIVEKESHLFLLQVTCSSETIIDVDPVPSEANNPPGYGTVNSSVDNSYLCLEGGTFPHGEVSQISSSPYREVVKYGHSSREVPLQMLIESINESLENLWHSGFSLGFLNTHYSPWELFVSQPQIDQAFSQFRHLPALWDPFRTVASRLMSPARRQAIYRMLKELRTEKNKGWFTYNRLNNICIVFPEYYQRSTSNYPRIFARENCTKNKLSLVGVHRKFRKTVLGDLSRYYRSKIGWEVFELDIRSCHTEILAGLDVGTPNLVAVLDENRNIWEAMKEEIDSALVQEAQELGKLTGNDLLKICLKRIAYKGLQGGRIDSAERIYSSLETEAKQLTTALYKGISGSREKDDDEEPELLFAFDFGEKSQENNEEESDYHLVKLETPVSELSPQEHAKVIIRKIADQISSVTLLQEFDRLNYIIRTKTYSSESVCVYTPMDKNPLIYSWEFNDQVDLPEHGWKTNNRCRLASQILIGVEMLELMLIIEGLVEKKIPWIPFSFHHDGFAFMGEREALAEQTKTIEEHVKNRLLSLGLRPLALEISDYPEPNSIEIDALEEVVKQEPEWISGDYQEIKKSKERKKKVPKDSEIFDN